MKDRDLENQINVKLDDWTYRKIVTTANATEQWKGEIVRKCIMRVIRQDSAPKWKKLIAKLIKY
jgi:hypothetical protein